MTSLFIVNRTGTVHRFPSANNCHALGSRQREPVSTLQALVFKLGHCDSCWTNVAEYERTIGRRAAQ